MSQAASLPAQGDSTGEFRSPVKDTRLSLDIGSLTHTGNVRKNNEDHYLVAKMAKSMRICDSSLPEDSTRFSDEEGHLFIVADGMGGAASGEQASALAVKTVEEFVLNTVKWFLHLGRTEENALLLELRRALERADRNVIDQAREDIRLSGMGTTLTMAFSVASDLFVVHAGDSRAYLFRDGALEQITNDHTLVQQLVDAGAITPEAAKRHVRRNVVTNVVGGPREGVEAEIHKINLRDGDVLLLCSDGLTEPVSDEHIADVLRRDEPAKALAKRLVDLALLGGGPDNVTAVVARYRAE